MIILRSFNISIYLFIHLSIYIFISQYIYLIYNISEPLSRGVFLTLLYHMHFIKNGNGEIQAKILEFIADRMQQPLHVLILGMWQFYCHNYFALISLCFMVVGL